MAHFDPAALGVQHDLGFDTRIDAHRDNPFGVGQVSALQQQLLVSHREVLLINDNLA